MSSTPQMITILGCFVRPSRGRCPLRRCTAPRDHFVTFIYLGPRVVVLCRDHAAEMMGVLETSTARRKLALAQRLLDGRFQNGNFMYPIRGRSHLRMDVAF